MTRRRIHGSRIRGKTYGFPFMTCANVLICRKKDYTPVNNIFEIEGGLSAPLKSMIGYYSILAFCNYQDGGENNGILRYSNNFYEEFDLRKAYLLDVIQSMEDDQSQ